MAGIVRSESRKTEETLDKLAEALKFLNLRPYDVLEVTRCKDCKYRVGSSCDYSTMYVKPNGYCSHGERSDDDPSHPFADDVMMGE